LGTGKTAEFEFGRGFVDTRVVGGGAGLDGLLNREGDCDRPGRCNLLEGPDGGGRCGIAGAADTGLPKFALVVVLSVPVEG